MTQDEVYNKAAEKIADINQGFFLKEFSFSKNEFSPPQSTELEFSDQVIWLDDLLITFQIKEREIKTIHSVETEIKWFQKKILGDATKQIRDTLSYLNKYQEINIRNGRGHLFNVASGNIKKNLNIVLYAPNELLPIEYQNKKFHISKTAGFIHLISARDYIGICHTLLTIHEISEYLEFREKICKQFEAYVNLLPEQALVGQFLCGEFEVKPDLYFVQYLATLNQEVEKFDFLHITRYFAEHITSFKNKYDYYKILEELAKLKREELTAFKLRFDLCIEKSKSHTFELPYRITVPRTECGFVFIIVPNEKRLNIENGLINFTDAHKYDQKLNKCIGSAFLWDGQGYDILWCYLNETWVYDEGWEKILKEDFPFREVKGETLNRYVFKKE